MLRGADQECACGCLEAAVRYVREACDTRGAFRGRLGQVLAATLHYSMSAMPPIVLQKSFCTGDRKFCGPPMRFSCKDVGEPHLLTFNSQATSLM